MGTLAGFLSLEGKAEPPRPLCLGILGRHPVLRPLADWGGSLVFHLEVLPAQCVDEEDGDKTRRPHASMSLHFPSVNRESVYKSV